MKRIVTLLVVLVSTSVFGQVEDTTKSIFENSSVYRDYREVYLSNLGQAKYHLLSPFESNNRQFINLFPDSSNSPTFTDIFYVSGSGRENYVEVIHHQQLGKYLKGEANILKTISEGIYVSNEAQLSNFEVGLSYSPEKKNYQFEANFSNYKRFAFLNGGIADSTFFSLLDSSNGNLKSTFPNQFNVGTGSNSNRLDLKVMNINFDHSFRLGNIKSDTNTFLALRQTLLYSRTQRNIELINSSDFFQNYYLDSITTNDSLRLEQVSHRIQLEKISKNSIMAIGLGQNYYEYSSLAPFEVHLENLIFGQFQLKKDSVEFHSYGEFMISDGSYESFEWRNKVTVTNSTSSVFSNFSLEANYFTDLPELYVNRYASNHFVWNKVNKRNSILQVSANATNDTKRYAASLHFENQNNAVFFDENSQPIQAQIAYLNLSLKKEFKFTNWFYLSSNLHVQDLLTDANIEVPNLLLQNSLFFRGRLIKKVLRFKAGVNVLYYSQFTPRNYNPALDEFILQSSQKVGNYPIMDVFAEFYIKRNFSFFALVTHVNSNVFTGKNLNGINPNWNLPSNFGKNYLAISQYPIQDRAFKFGIKWRLFD